MTTLLRTLLILLALVVIILTGISVASVTTGFNKAGLLGIAHNAPMIRDQIVDQR